MRKRAQLPWMQDIFKQVAEQANQHYANQINSLNTEISMLSGERDVLKAKVRLLEAQLSFKQNSRIE